MSGIFNSIVGWLSVFFNMLHSYIGIVIPDNNLSYGLAIILFTFIIRLLLLPLNIKQMRSTKRMNEVQPEIKKLQTKYKSDPTKQNEELMKLYKEKGINPLGGCLPLLIQMPILMALYWVFMGLKGIDGVRFLWISNLAKPDNWFILPILSGATTYLSSAMMAPKEGDQAKQMSTMNIGMSIFLVVMSWRMQASLVLYWVFNNLFQVGQVYLLKIIDKKPEEEEV